MSKVLRVAIVYQNRVFRDGTLRSGVVSLGMGESNSHLIRPIGIPEGHTLIRDRVLRITDQLEGRLGIGDQEGSVAELIESGALKKTGSVEVEDGGKATVYEATLTDDDWGVLRFGETEVVFQYVLPAAVVSSAAPFKGIGGALAIAVTALFSVLGLGLVLSFALQMGFLFWANWIDDSEDYDNYVQMDERWVEVITDADEQEEEEELIEEEEEEPDIDTAGKRAEGEEGKFGEEDPEDPDTQLPDIDGRMVEKLDKPVGIQAAMSSNLLGSGGANSLFGSGNQLGDAMDQVAMNGEGDAYNAGFGYGGMGTMGRGSGGGGSGAGRIGGLADHDTGGGRGSGKGLGKKAKAKVKPKVKFEKPKESGFCEARQCQQRG